MSTPSELAELGAEPDADEHSPIRRGRLLGRYVLAYELASGGMATVYLARADGPAGFGKLVALKLIHPHLAKQREFVEMFLDEARIAARIVHPNVCSVFDFGEEDGTYFLAMDYLVGETVGRLMRAAWRKRPIVMRPATPRIFARIVADACEGLHAAHEARGDDGELLGIVHRDVTPQNLFLGYDGSVRVVDFGVAVSVGRAHQTTAGTLKGKYPYMSPEQVLQKPLDRRSDVWSLGVCLWEMLSGRRLFGKDGEFETLRAVTASPVPPVSAAGPHVPKLFDPILARALDRDRDRRYPSARELGRDLAAAVGKLGGAGAADVAELMDELFATERAERLALIEKARRIDPEHPSTSKVAPAPPAAYGRGLPVPLLTHGAAPVPLVTPGAAPVPLVTPGAAPVPLVTPGAAPLPLEVARERRTPVPRATPAAAPREPAAPLPSHAGPSAPNPTVTSGPSAVPLSVPRDPTAPFPLTEPASAPVPLVTPGTSPVLLSVPRDPTAPFPLTEPASAPMPLVTPGASPVLLSVPRDPTAPFPLAEPATAPIPLVPGVSPAPFVRDATQPVAVAAGGDAVVPPRSRRGLLFGGALALFASAAVGMGLALTWGGGGAAAPVGAEGAAPGPGAEPGGSRAASTGAGGGVAGPAAGERAEASDEAPSAPGEAGASGASGVASEGVAGTTSPAPASPGSSAPADRSGRDRGARRGEREAPAPGGTGTLNVVTPPGWAELFVGGTRVGRSPTTITLPSGRTRVRLVPYGTGTPIERSVVVEAGGTARLVVRLDAP